MEKQVTGRICPIGGLIATMILATTFGCGNSTTVTGKIRYRARSVTYGSVTFVAADKKAHSAAIEPDGSYTVEGLRPGTFLIGVISRDPTKGRSVLRDRKPDDSVDADGAAQPSPSGGWFPLPAELESPLNSGLSCTLGAGRITHDIDMK